MLNYIEHYQRSENPVDVEQLYATTVDDVERALGEEHPDLLCLNSVLGQILIGRGDYEQALLNLTKSSQVCEHSLGSSNPNTFTALSYVASVYKHQGKLKDAEELKTR